MKHLVWGVLILALAMGLVLAISANVGYVLLVYPPYRIDFSLNFLILALLAGFTALYLTIRVVVHTLRLPAYVREFKAARRLDKGRRASEEAQIAFAEGRYARAERLAAEALELDTMPAVNALLAAQAAHAQQAYARRDEYLQRAEKLAPEHKVARMMASAEFLLDERRAAEALPLIKQLKESAGKHTGVLRLELRAEQLMKNWDQVLAVLAQLQKRDGIEPAHAEQLRINAHVENLRRKAHDAAQLREYWAKLAAGDRTNTRIAQTAARFFLALGGTREAREIIEQSLEAQWDSTLAELYGQCYDKDVVRQIERAEQWLREHPRDPHLLLALGRLCARQELWGKSQNYIEASLAVESTREGHLALAQLLEKMNKADEACKHYRQSLALEAEA